MIYRNALFAVVAWSILFASCQKSELVLYQSHSINTQDDISTVYFHNAQTGIAVGGNTWTRAIVCRTANGGQNWNIDSVYDKKIFCAINSNTDDFFGMGIELNLYQVLPEKTKVFNIKHQGSFRFIRGMSMYNDQHFMAVHGLTNGSIEKFSITSDSTRTIIDVDRELYAIQCLDSLHWIACGFGIILQTKDAGELWDTLDISGDKFIDICWLAPNTLFILGAAGTILKSTDSGLHFRNTRKGGIINHNPLYNAICFKNNAEGIIAGDRGQILFTRDGGAHWILAEGLPDFDVFDCFHDGIKYWLCGSKGTIVSFSL